MVCWDTEMVCPKPTYGSRSDAKRHGAITYGKGNYTVRQVKGGYRAYKKPNKPQSRWAKAEIDAQRMIRNAFG